MKICVYSCDSYLGIHVVQELLYGKHGQEISQVVCGVGCIRSPFTYDLIEMGAMVKEVDPTSESELTSMMEGVDVVVLLPNFFSTSEWQKSMETSMKALERSAKHVKRALMLSALAVEAMEEGNPEKLSGDEKYPNIYKLKKLEESFLSISENMKLPYSVVRIAPPQQVMLLYSRMLQEIGQLLLPIGSAKCSWVDIRDVGKCLSCLVSSSSSSHLSSTAFSTTASITSSLSSMFCAKTMSSDPHHAKVVRLTGPETLDGKAMIEKLNKVLQLEYEFSDTDSVYSDRYLRSEFGEQAYELVNFMLETFEIIKQNKLSFVTDDIKKCIGADPKDMDSLLKQYGDFFRP